MAKTNDFLKGYKLGAQDMKTEILNLLPCEQRETTSVLISNMERLMIEKAEISCKLAEYENGKL
jgi:hypothetical protein